MPDVSTPSASQEAVIGDIAVTFQLCHASLEKLRTTHPDWYAFFEDSQADSADRVVLTELLRTAPDDFSRGLLYGLHIMHSQILELTKREGV